MNDYSDEKGIAFIVEGATERVFYEEYLKKLCSERGMTITKDEKSQENKYTICAENRSILVLINNVGSVSQMTNSDITKFHEGDWLRLRQSIESDAESIADLAAQADIEDVMLCDFQGVLAFLGLDNNTPMPKGRKGKVKIKQPFRRSDPACAYHEGERARALIQTLDIDLIENTAPVPLSVIRKAVDFD